MNKILQLLGLIVAVSATFDYVTLNSGKGVTDAVNSQTAGARGPILLQDVQLIERLQVHNRERIPERNVHARGAVAKGHFVSTADVSKLTMADLFTKGKETKLACRFSTVINSVGSPEFLRDPRGFALKFYTEQGNYDIVGLDFPIFFIRDGIRFPEMIRSLKPSQKDRQQHWWRTWDYFSNFPESTHMFSWLLDDVGIPASYREVDGWGIHTYKWVNEAGNSTYVRYYWKSAQGVHSLNDTEAVKQHFSFATADLYDNIEQGNYPKWTMYYQAIPFDDNDFINSLDFDILDTTKEWPADKIPMHELGHFELNENPISQFLENDQIAFSPGRLVQGVEPSDEKMLQTRIFAYADTQTYRLGVNNQMLPINRPKCPYMDQHFDGQMNFYDTEFSPSAREINYFPSTINKTIKVYPKYFHETEEIVDGKKVRQMIPKTNDFEQPGDRWRSFDEARQDRFAKRVAMTLMEPQLTDEVKNIWLSNWGNADPALAKLIEKYINEFNLAKFAESSGLLLSEEHNDLKEEMDAFERASGYKIKFF